MVPLDDYQKWWPLMAESARLYLNRRELEQFSLLSPDDISNQLGDLLEKPIANFTLVNDVYFRARWAELIWILCLIFPLLSIIFGCIYIHKRETEFGIMLIVSSFLLHSLAQGILLLILRLLLGIVL